METGETNEGPGDGVGDYGHSGGGPFREPAARAPYGASDGGAAGRETAGMTEGLGDGGGGDQDGGNSGRTGGGNRGLGPTVTDTTPIRPGNWKQLTTTQQRNWRKRHGKWG